MMPAGLTAGSGPAWLGVSEGSRSLVGRSPQPQALPADSAYTTTTHLLYRCYRQGEVATDCLPRQAGPAAALGLVGDAGTPGVARAGSIQGRGDAPAVIAKPAGGHPRKGNSTGAGFCLHWAAGESLIRRRAAPWPVRDQPGGVNSCAAFGRQIVAHTAVYDRGQGKGRPNRLQRRVAHGVGSAVAVGHFE
jgi:hypothetical protein